MHYFNPLFTPSFFRSPIPPQPQYPDIDHMLDNVENKDIDFHHFIDYIELKNYEPRNFSQAQRDRILAFITDGFVRQCEATFYFAKSIQLNRTIYTNKYTGNELYIYDINTWVLLTDFLKVYDALRKSH